MSLESILAHILDEATAQKEKIIQDAQQEARRIIQEAQKGAERLYQESIDKEKALYESQKQSLLVNARLEAKSNYLRAKQELIDSVFENVKSSLNKDKLKKQQVFIDKTQTVSEDVDFYLNHIRPDYEAEIARILFA
jgi:V/A-type H+-transporting ATPase subunit E